jgi:V8-like Glu-specific endopeptidase
MVVRTFVGLAVCALFLAAGAAAPAETPEQLFAADASGMLKVGISCPTTKGKGEASGFLLGPSLMMTARHVMVDPQTGKDCHVSVVQEGTGKRAHVTRWMAIRSVRAKSSTDLALAVLDNSFSGYSFSLAHSSPKPHQLVLAMGYALNQPLSFNQGHVTSRPVRQHVRLLSMSLLETHGASGGPVLDAKGDVVGLTQAGFQTGSQESVDLASLVGDDPMQFCFGVAVGLQSTVCPAQRRPSLLTEDGPPALCVGFALVVPFDGPCPMYADDITGVVEVKSQCTKLWTGSGFLLGPRLLMTDRAILTDPVTGATCRATVLTIGAAKPVRIVRWTAVQADAPFSPTGVVLAVLATPVKGFHFTLSPTSPRLGETVHELTSTLGFPARGNQGRVAKRLTLDGLTVFQVNASAAGGAGGPIVDANNNVVGIIQWGSKKQTLAVDLASLLASGDTSGFCFGDAKGLASTVCPGLAGDISPFEAEGPVQVCGGQAADPPFSNCPPLLTDCWVAPTSTGDKSTAVTQVTESSSGGLYLILALRAEPAKGTTMAVDLTSPYGVNTANSIYTLQSGSSAQPRFYVGPIGLGDTPSAVRDGTWKLTATLSDSSTCSTSFDLTPG